ncbi:SigE family RNA polymerase sigma factor [Micromonospora sp. HM5-17]|uniref:SigE family RNA polymerase sigma factor n=1 Tax=Micromonospora sp. HM5-17 TaxID=2487710 RepID=UPI001F39DB02|nr:SigE family RNA polymerase sigma factor [Micromonospora sp. HM5-17]
MAPRHSMDEEFREFVAARSAALLRTAYLLAGDWATAEDLLQTALTKTYLAWKRLGEIEAVEPYARRVLINTATSWWRRRWHGERPTEILPERPAPDEIEPQLERDRLWRHLQSLPVRQRAILVLRYYEDLSEAQTAALLNISPGTVKSQTSRALHTLRRRLGAEADRALDSAAPGLSPASRTTAGIARSTASSAGRTPAPAGVGPRTIPAAGSTAPRRPDELLPAGRREESLPAGEPAPRPRQGGARRPAAALEVPAPVIPVLGAEA